MIYFQDIMSYEEFIFDDFIKHGRTTLLNLIGEDASCVILEEFNAFKALHDKYLESENNEINRNGLIKLN